MQERGEGMKDDEVLNNINEIIAKSGLKKAYIAEQMSISDKSLSDILHKRKKLNTQLILSFCKVMNVTPNDLYGYNK